MKQTSAVRSFRYERLRNSWLSLHISEDKENGWLLECVFSQVKKIFTLARTTAFIVSNNLCVPVLHYLAQTSTL
ncbi:hypothetical protein BRADI_3g18375v3 [Brachypodium distachyon]|uniref:Uncharacterized protein n=1 Tax=Brachypodium distachyon TaxID=15368 RepID=A0A0Q3FBS0_BRADI|nr:hypothetical protein BRADI_3g18375v3 [Brachypodium distachyon]